MVTALRTEVDGVVWYIGEDVVGYKLYITKDHVIIEMPRKTAPLSLWIGKPITAYLHKDSNGESHLLIRWRPIETQPLDEELSKLIEGLS